MLPHQQFRPPAMPNFAQTIFDGMQRAQGRVLLRWPVDGRTEVWTADRLLRIAAGFSQQISTTQEVNGKAFVPLQALNAPRLMALLTVMGFGGSLLVPPAGQWLSVLRAWRKRTDFGGVVLVDAAPMALRILLWAMRIRILRLTTGELDRLPATIELAGDQAALISLSSGSTGTPKVLLRSHRLLLAQHDCLRQSFPPFEGQLDSSVFANVLLHQLATGTCSQLPTDLSKGIDKLDYRQLSADWRAAGVNSITGNPYVFQRILALDEPPYPAVRAVGIGGAPVPDELLHRMQYTFPNATLYVIYGATEAEPIALRAFAKTQDPRLGYCVGRPVSCLSGLEIRDPQAIRVGEAWIEAGEIFVSGPHVLTKHGDWHGTGDYGYLRDGVLYLTARAGNTTPCAGYQHYQIEHALRSEANVTHVAVETATQGIRIAYCGTASKQDIEAVVQLRFPEIAQIEVYSKAALPLDKRHHSKLLYHQIDYAD